MEGNSPNLDKTKDVEAKVNKPKKKHGAKIAVILIIVIMALIIGVLTWMLVSGKDFSTIFNKNNEEQSDNKDKNVSSGNNSGNSTDKNDDGDNVNGMVSGKGGDEENTTSNTNLKDSFKVSYDTRGVRNITIGGASFVCNEDVPHISGISKSAAEKMEKYLNNWYSEVWKDINSQTDDDYIKEILNGMNEASQNNPEYVPYDIGFHQTYKVVYLTNKLVTFQYIFEGGLGGVSWGNTSGVSFDLETGDVIEIKNIVTSKEKYIQACKDYVYDELKKDSRYEEVLEMHGSDYQSTINSAIEQLGGYLVEDGIVCAEIPKYAIASGASGEFIFTIPYSLVKDYINNKYIENVNSNSSSQNNNQSKNSWN